VKPDLILCDSSIKLKKISGEVISSHKYSQINSSLLQLTNFSKLGIAYEVGRLEKYAHNSHWMH